MFPLKVTIVGCEGELLRLLRLELSVCSARIEAEFLGIESAIAGLHEGGSLDDTRTLSRNRRNFEPRESQKRLFIVYVPSLAELPGVKRLSTFFAGHAILVLMEPSADPRVPIAAMRVGASQVVMLPLQTDDFKLALDCVASQYGAPASCQVVAVAGATGGCGATTIAINLAFEVSQARAMRVILAELSVRVGKLPLYLNVEPRYTTYDLLSEAHRLDSYFVQQALTSVVDRFHVLAGPYQGVAPINPRPSDVLRLIDCLRSMADMIILDVPCNYDSVYYETLAAADMILLVGEQKVPSIHALQMVQRSLSGKAHHLVLNRYDPNLPGFEARRLTEMLGTKDILTIASDYASVSTAINQGLPLGLKEPRSAVLGDIAVLAQTLVPGAASAGDGRKAGMLGGLIRALGKKK
jgi:pilus assembly protein CpaE